MQTQGDQPSDEGCDDWRWRQHEIGSAVLPLGAHLGQSGQCALCKEPCSQGTYRLWIDKKISFGGISFDDSSDALTEEDFRQKLRDLFLF